MGVFDANHRSGTCPLALHSPGMRLFLIEKCTKSALVLLFRLQITWDPRGEDGPKGSRAPKAQEGRKMTCGTSVACSMLHSTCLAGGTRRQRQTQSFVCRRTVQTWHVPKQCAPHDPAVAVVSVSRLLEHCSLQSPFRIDL